MTVPPRHLTDHAIARYRSRVGAATREEIQTVVDQGEVRYTPPGRVELAQRADVYVVCGDAVFPAHEVANGLVLTTCVCRRRLSKADRRAYRELLREEQDWTAAA